jgi:two-component system alkaline phosphatase synthesis response regulator PhoP
MKRVLLIEDEPAVAKGLVFGLKEEGYEVLWAKSCASGIEMLKNQSPELMILDIRLPDGSGFDLCRQIRSQGYHLPVLMLTARDEEADKILGLELGADDYMVKPFSFHELLSRIRALARRAYGELAEKKGGRKRVFGDLVIDFDRFTAFRDGEDLRLTPTEYKLLRELVEASGRTFSREMLIEAVWGSGFILEDERTVDVHIRHLREKIEDDPARPRYIETVRGFGYRFNQP